MTDPMTIIAGALGFSLVAFVGLWLLSVALKDASIVDIYWGPSFLFLIWPAALIWQGMYGGDWPPATIAVLLLVSLWSFRLGLYLFIRNKGHGEDYRYQRMRANNDPGFWWKSIYIVFGLQFAVGAVVSTPALAVIALAEPGAGVLGVVGFMGIALSVIGILFEAVGDAQLAAYKKDPANQGKLMDRGLWAWTRHPNYFGNACIWWGIGLIAIDQGQWWGIIGSATMTYFLLNISGKAMLERDMSKKRPEYADYIARTSGFFPLPPKSK